MQKSFEQVSAELGQARIQERRIEEELGRLVQAIADGQPSKSLTTAINDRERELGAITHRLLEPGPESLGSKRESLKTFALSRLINLRELMSHPQSVDQTRRISTGSRCSLWQILIRTVTLRRLPKARLVICSDSSVLVR
jgi:hypothetical protein